MLYPHARLHLAVGGQSEAFGTEAQGREEIPTGYLRLMVNSGWKTYYDDVQKDSKKNPEIVEAFDEARKAQRKTQEEVAHESEKSALSHYGAKRRYYGKAILPPFDGVSDENSELIRDYVAFEFMGYSQTKIIEKLQEGNFTDKKYQAIRATLMRYPKAVEAAREEASKQCMLRYHQNLWVIRAALTDAGPKAISTIIELMGNKDVAPGTRLKASTEVLKMLNVAGTASAGSEQVKFEIAGAIRDAREEVKSDRIVEAEDAEVIEDGDAGDSSSDEQDGG